MAIDTEKFNTVKYSDYDIHFHAETDSVDADGTFVINKESAAALNHPEYLPSWDPTQKFAPLKFYKHEEPGARADKNLPNLFPEGKDFQLKKITPKLGSQVTGIQLSDLTPEGKDELALFVAQRGVVVFRDQDWAHKGPKYITDYTRHFGRLHIHPTSGAPKGFPELHITYRRPDPQEFERTFAHKNNNVGWHSDVSYELQPPGTTFFAVLDGPEAGGDTIFADTVEAYNRLSPEFQKRLEGLHALHSSVKQASNSSGYGGIQRRDPVEHIHPLIRVHPATGQKAIYVNKPFTRRIVELKQEESDYLLNFLYNHIESAQDLQLRASWEKDTVVVWDNRRLVHSAIIDWDAPVSRHAVRVTPQAERPVENLEDLNKPEVSLGDVADALDKLAS